MKKYDLLGYFFVCLGVAGFICLTVWLVHYEGQRTRESIHDAAKETGVEMRKTLTEVVDHTAEKAAELPGKVIRDIKKEIQVETKETPGESAEKADKADTNVGEAKDAAVDKSEATSAGQPEGTPSRNEPAGADQSDSVGRRQAGPPPSEPGSQNPAVQSDQSAGGSNNGKIEQPAPKATKPMKQNRPVAKPTMKDQRSEDKIGEMFDLGHKLSKSIDDTAQEAFGLSLAEEKKVGRDVHKVVGQNQKILSAPELVQRLSKLARPISDQRARKEITITFWVLNSPEVNAFSHVGGYIYVNKGLLDFVESDAELQFILAHEIAHVDLRHATKRVTYSARAAKLGGEAGRTMAQIAYSVIALGYTKDEEFEADAWAMRAMLAIGRTREEAMEGLRHLETYFDKEHPEARPVAPSNNTEKAVRQIQNHFSSHPPTAERIKRLEELEIQSSTGAD